MKKIIFLLLVIIISGCSISQQIRNDRMDDKIEPIKPLMNYTNEENKLEILVPIYKF